MTFPATAAAAPLAPARTPGGGAATRRGASPQEPDAPWTAFTELFPPQDSDVDGHRSWLARCPWPEVVFASAR